MLDASTYIAHLLGTVTSHGSVGSAPTNDDDVDIKTNQDGPSVGWTPSYDFDICRSLSTRPTDSSRFDAFYCMYVCVCVCVCARCRCKMLRTRPSDRPAALVVSGCSASVAAAAVMLLLLLQVPDGYIQMITGARGMYDLLTRE